MRKKWSKTYKGKSTEEKEQEIKELTSGMEESIEGYFHSLENLKEYLGFMGAFRKYSTSNVMLIQKQFQGAQAVGSFLFWKNNGFTVNKGEKGIKILVPVNPTPYFKDEKGKRKSLSNATKEEQQKIKAGKIKVIQGHLTFRIGHVFEMSQTNAKASDLPKIFPNRWLEGTVENYDVLYKGMEAIALNNGITIVEPKGELGVVKGASYPYEKEVALNPRNSELQNVKTLLHELSHAKLHTWEKREDYSVEEREFQAEMTAYSVASYFGIDTEEYSLSYLANWTQGKELEDKERLLKEVHETSLEFIGTLEETIEKEHSLYTITIDAWSGSYDEAGRIHMLDRETQESCDYTIWVGDKYDRDSSYICLMDSTGERDTVSLGSVVSHDVYEKLQETIFDHKGDISLELNEKKMDIDVKECIKDEKYGALVDRTEEKEPVFEAKEIRTYKELQEQGYERIPVLDKKIEERKCELKETYRVYKHLKEIESPEDVDGILTRLEAEMKHHQLVEKSIKGGYVTEEWVNELELGIDKQMTNQGDKPKGQERSNEGVGQVVKKQVVVEMER